MGEKSWGTPALIIAIFEVEEPCIYFEMPVGKIWFHYMKNVGKQILRIIKIRHSFQIQSKAW